MIFRTLIILILFMCCHQSSALSEQNAEGNQSHPNSYVEELKVTLSNLNLSNPALDLHKNNAVGDFRFRGIISFGCHVPGQITTMTTNYIEKFGIKCLAGTSDDIASNEQEILQQQVIDYCLIYNKALLIAIKAKESEK